MKYFPLFIKQERLNKLCDARKVESDGSHKRPKVLTNDITFLGSNSAKYIKMFILFNPVISFLKI